MTGGGKQDAKRQIEQSSKFQIDRESSSVREKGGQRNEIKKTDPHSKTADRALKKGRRGRRRQGHEEKWVLELVFFSLLFSQHPDRLFTM